MYPPQGPRAEELAGLAKLKSRGLGLRLGAGAGAGAWAKAGAKAGARTGLGQAQKLRFGLGGLGGGWGGRSEPFEGRGHFDGFPLLEGILEGILEGTQ